MLDKKKLKKAKKAGVYLADLVWTLGTGIPVPPLSTMARIKGLWQGFITALDSRKFEKARKAYEGGHFKTSFAIVKSLAEKGYAQPQFNLAFMYHSGRGVRQNFTKAIKWYRRAADQNHADAQNNLGAMYHEGLGIPKNYDEDLRYQKALYWYFRAAEQKDARGRINIGLIYAFGLGVPQDYIEAVRWYRLSAMQGFLPAMHNLAAVYERGENVPKELLGVPHDIDAAVKLYRRAAKHGYPPSQSDLGSMYFQGLGVQQSLWKGAAWFHRAAKQGAAIAQFNLALFYAMGLGAMKRNLVTTYMWFYIAYKNGHEDSEAEIRHLASHLSPADIAKAEAMAKKWLAKHPLAQFQ